MIKSKNIELFRNLSLYDLDGEYYDFHNEYDCINITLGTDKVLLLTFESTLNKKKVQMKFFDVEIKSMIFFNYAQSQNLTIDNLYRGRFEEQGKLYDFSDDEKGCFYLEFYEGQTIEFWSIGVNISG